MNEPTEYLRFNLNYYLFVKLLPYGFELWEAGYNRHLPDRWRKPTEYFQGKADADGYVKFQAWEFMQVFGPHIHLAMEPFQTDVLFRASELHPAHPAAPAPTVPAAAGGGAAPVTGEAGV